MQQSDCSHCPLSALSCLPAATRMTDTCPSELLLSGFTGERQWRCCSFLLLCATVCLLCCTLRWRAPTAAAAASGELTLAKATDGEGKLFHQLCMGMHSSVHASVAAFRFYYPYPPAAQLYCSQPHFTAPREFYLVTHTCAVGEIQGCFLHYMVLVKLTQTQARARGRVVAAHLRCGERLLWPCSALCRLPCPACMDCAALAFLSL